MAASELEGSPFSEPVPSPGPLVGSVGDELEAEDLYPPLEATPGVLEVDPVVLDSTVVAVTVSISC